jgi:hypothetical protein
MVIQVDGCSPPTESSSATASRMLRPANSGWCPPEVRGCYYKEQTTEQNHDRSELTATICKLANQFKPCCEAIYNMYTTCYVTLQIGLLFERRRKARLPEVQICRCLCFYSQGKVRAQPRVPSGGNIIRCTCKLLLQVPGLPGGIVSWQRQNRGTRRCYVFRHKNMTARSVIH